MVAPTPLLDNLTRQHIPSQFTLFLLWVHEGSRRAKFNRKFNNSTGLMLKVLAVTGRGWARLSPLGNCGLCLGLTLLRQAFSAWILSCEVAWPPRCLHPRKLPVSLVVALYLRPLMPAASRLPSLLWLSPGLTLLQPCWQGCGLCHGMASVS